MTIADIKKTTDTKMEQSIAALKNNLAKVRTGRANPALLDTIHVDYYGSQGAQPKQHISFKKKSFTNFIERQQTSYL